MGIAELQNKGSDYLVRMRICSGKLRGKDDVEGRH